MKPTILPTLEAFTALSLRERSLVFLDWVRNQPAEDTYAPGDTQDCALCRFARDLGVHDAGANASEIHGAEVDNLLVLPASELHIIFAPESQYSDLSTFEALANRLTAVLRETEGCNPS